MITNEMFDRKGLEIVITSEKTTVDEYGRRFSLRIDYVGAAVSEYDIPEETCDCPGDPYCLCRIASPVPDDLNSTAVFGAEARNGELWLGYMTVLRMKDPGFLKNGMRLVYTVPDDKRVLGTDITVSVENDIVFTRRLDAPGTYEEIIDISGAGKEVIDYLNDAHRLQKKLLEEWIGYCAENGIDYQLVCGAALGAFREGDMVPWDDDIDVAVTREDFDRMISLGEWADETEEGFVLVRPEDMGDDVFLDGMTRLVYTKQKLESSLLENLPEEAGGMLRDRASLDIYIIEKGFNCYVLHKLQTAALKAIYGMEMAYRGKFDEETYRHTHSKRDVEMVKFLMRVGGRIPLPKLRKLYDRVSRLKRSGGAKYCFFSNGYIGSIDRRFERAWFGKGRKAKFGDLDVTIPEEIEKYLAAQYGDYMGLPNGWSRKPGHFRPKVDRARGEK